MSTWCGKREETRTGNKSEGDARFIIDIGLVPFLVLEGAPVLGDAFVEPVVLIGRDELTDMPKTERYVDTEYGAEGNGKNVFAEIDHGDCGYYSSLNSWMRTYCDCRPLISSSKIGLGLV